MRRRDEPELHQIVYEAFQDGHSLQKILEIVAEAFEAANREQTPADQIHVR